MYRDEVPGDIALLTVVGSRAYGTAGPGSDWDWRGVYVAPTERLFDLRPPQETVARTEPDVTLHELGKFCSLCARANPTVLEVLWSDRWDLHERDTSVVPEGVVAPAPSPDGQLLRDVRAAFLSKRVLKTYGGYARQQLGKAQRGVGGSKRQTDERRDKFVLHIYRLMLGGIHVLRTGEVLVRVPNPGELIERSRQPLSSVEADFERLEGELTEAAETTMLPDEPDYALIDQTLRTIRRRNLQ